MFSLKLIEQKASTGKKKKAVDLCPHPNKKMKIDFSHIIEEAKVKKTKLKKNEIDKKKMLDVCHPVKNMRIEMDSTTYSKDEAEDKKSQKRSSGRYFSLVKSVKHVINPKHLNEESRETYTRITNDLYESSNDSNKLKKAQKEHTVNEPSNMSNTSKKNKNSDKNEADCNNIKPVLMKRKEYALNSSNVNSSNDESSEDEKEWGPWKVSNNTDDNTATNNMLKLKKCTSVKATKKSTYDSEEESSCSEDDWVPWKSFNLSQDSEAFASDGENQNELKKVDFYNGLVVGEPECIFGVDDSNYIIVLQPGVSFYLQGVVKVSLIAGFANIFGYDLKKNETVTLYSSGNYSLLSIDAIKGDDLHKDQYSYIFDYNIVLGNKDMMTKMRYGVAVQLTKQDATFSQCLHAAGFKNVFLSDKFIKHAWSEVLGINPITSQMVEFKQYNLFKQNSDWQQCIKDAKEILHKQGSKIIICGGKGVGKSTMLKHIINSMLSNCEPSKRVFCLDLDPGQPEMSLPGTISLSCITKPLLGQSFTHFENNEGIKRIKQVFLGSVSVEKIIFQYCDAVKNLSNVVNEIASDYPVLINTMGWTRNIGYDLIVDLLKILQPTHVIDLQSNIRSRNFPYELDSKSVSNSVNGIAAKDITCSLSYQYRIVNSLISQESNNKELSHGKDKRELRFMAYFSGLWSQQTLKPTIVVPWNNVALHIIGNLNVPDSHILLALNSSLVALTNINKQAMNTLSEDLFKTLHSDALIDYTPECHGWGIIKGIDTRQKTLHILSPLSEEEFLTNVNCIIMCDVMLPGKIHSLFSTEDAPYFQHGSRSGAARLAVGRKAKVVQKII